MKDPLSRKLVFALVALWLVIGLTDLAAFALPSLLGPTPGPIAVLIVEESEDRNLLTAGQRAVIQSNADDSVRAYCKAHCDKDTSGNPQFRVVDKDDSLERDSDLFKQLFALKREGVPWIVVKRGATVVSESLPKSEAEALALLKRYGGK